MRRLSLITMCLLALGACSSRAALLKPSVAAHLCQVLRLDSQDSRCQGQDVSASQFLQDFHWHYNWGTPRERVDAEIGEYLTKCDKWTSTASDGVFQDCYYDFSGDGASLLRITYNGNYPDPFDFSKVPSGNSGGHVWAPWMGEYTPEN
jgi:hypothetical protein